MADDRERKAAEAKFKKSERATEGAQAMSEYNAERQAERAKTARLRELRLAKEAADKKKGSDPAPADRKLGDSRATKADKQKRRAVRHSQTSASHWGVVTQSTYPLRWIVLRISSSGTPMKVLPGSTSNMPSGRHGAPSLGSVAPVSSLVRATRHGVAASNL